MSTIHTAILLAAGAFAWPWLQSRGHEDWFILAAFLAVGVAITVDAFLLS